MRTAEHTVISFKGKAVTVPSVSIEGRRVIVTGKWLKTATVMDEEVLEGEIVRDPGVFTSELRNGKPKCDLFTFSQKVPDSRARYGYYLEWDNIAVVDITCFAEWWGKLTDAVRRAVKKAHKMGVVVKVSELDERFIEGIRGIYNETPVRQGRVFWHYQKSFEAIKQENATYPDRSIFIGAYCGDELIGFSRLVLVDCVAHMIQIISKMKHHDKRPTNALISSVVEVCERKGISHLVYGNYVYNDPNSSLTEFKRRNGFRPVLVPRYYIPLTLKGKMALTLGLHHGVKGLIPAHIKSRLIQMRGRYYGRLAEIRKAMCGESQNGGL